ncbi:MAG: MYXO-CTERM sorting domain-containing protein [Sandaracinaceae bacterium]|nr:MYXO-CTERM sorting domain-containing protein [Sandaracinaceae bacterium]
MGARRSAAALRALLGLPQPTADAGPPSADAGPPTGHLAPTARGCGCRARSTGARPVGIFALLALALLVRRRPR